MNLVFKPLASALLATSLALAAGAAFGAEPLPSWNDGPSRTAIIDFVNRVTQQGGADYVAPDERIAVFDNDGTLWAEQPMYVQLAFALDRVKALAAQHPEWKTEQPFKAVLENDMAALAQSGEEGLLKMVMVTHAGMSTDEFNQIASDWIRTARHPKTGQPYTEMVYQPMLELLYFLRQNGFKTFIVSGGGIDFMRPWTESIYGIPPEQVIGSTIKVEYQLKDGKPTLVRQPALNFLDDKTGKPVMIQYHIGRRPIAAFGNSDGDIQMLEWTTSGAGPRLGMLLHHDDGKREFAYDRKSPFGKLDHGIEESKERNWSLISMKSEWKCVMKFECEAQQSK
ncbi:HAD family hydrolase [Pseudoxanthomonas dokdonensis]|uniref:Haloacid dehalogenase n=1 Tax=Pseudoxanthomonas dokdonensis TaxID=344882 RepID=A0A0R0CK98_9GAMM|nr:HAD family hydrolase [Pseudoxanthomonas dokdonensis]KRG69968.1 haloacid dehalogenase [Pseudoxanthomonas dokdonensis]